MGKNGDVYFNLAPLKFKFCGTTIVAARTRERDSLQQLWHSCFFEFWFRHKLEKAGREGVVEHARNKFDELLVDVFVVVVVVVVVVVLVIIVVVVIVVVIVVVVVVIVVVVILVVVVMVVVIIVVAVESKKSFHTCRKRMPKK